MNATQIRERMARRELSRKASARKGYIATAARLLDEVDFRNNVRDAGTYNYATCPRLLEVIDQLIAAGVVATAIPKRAVELY